MNKWWWFIIGLIIGVAVAVPRIINKIKQWWNNPENWKQYDWYGAFRDKDKFNKEIMPMFFLFMFLIFCSLYK